MTIVTLLRYLIGDREAILSIASNRHSLWIGLLFVLSAGFAREYDGEDLWHEPWHLLIPLGASLAASLLLFCLAREMGNVNAILSSNFWGSYLSFLGLFWMTAPLAWLYAIPYERFLTAPQAIDLNLITLGVVALWRVALMIRVLCVLTTTHPLAVTGIVAGYGTTLFAVISFFTNVTILGIMGGLRTYEERTKLQEVVIALTLCPAFLVGLACLSLLLIFRRKDVRWTSPNLLAQRPSAPLIGLALFSVLGWAFILPLTQPEQQRRREVEIALRQERFADAVALLTSHPREALPPHWTPPSPSLTPSFFSDRDLHFIDILVECDRQSAPEWVQKMYAKRLAIALANQSGGFWDDDLLARIAGALVKAKGGMEEVERLRAKEQQRPWRSQEPTCLDRIHAAMLDSKEKRELLPPPEIER